MLAAEAKDLIGPSLTAIVVGIGTVVTQRINHRRGKTRDAAGDAIVKRLETIDQKIDDYQGETRQAYRELDQRITKVSTTATEALHASVGVNGENGNRGDIKRVERRVERLEQIALAPRPS